MGGRLLEGPTMVGRMSDWKEELGRFLEPFLARLGHKARRQMCPLYVSGLIGPGDRKSRIAMSRSVIMPTSLSFSVTGNRPASIFFIKAAALRMVSSGLISCTSVLMTLLIFIARPPLFIYPHHITLGPGILFMTLQVDEPRPGFQRGRGLGNTPSSASKLFLVMRAPLVKRVGGIDAPAGTRARRTSSLLDAINGETLKQLRTSIL